MTIQSYGLKAKPMPVLYPGRFESTRFDRLGRGEEFDLSASSPSGPYVKVGKNSYGRKSLAAPRNNYAPQPFDTVTDIVGRVHYFNTPAISISGARRVVTPKAGRPIIYTSSIDSQGAANQGADPYLGPPFAPVFYQLFIDAPSTYANTGGSGGPVRLYWTIPSLKFLVLQEESGNTYKWRVWYGLTNNIAQATRIDVFPSGVSRPSAIPIVPSNYIWVAQWTNNNTTAPAGPNAASPFQPPSGTSYNGSAMLVFNNFFSPTYNPGDVRFSPFKTLHWDHFELRRGRGGTLGSADPTKIWFSDSNTLTDDTNTGIPNQSSVGTTTNGTFTTPAVGSSTTVVATDGTLVLNNQYVFINTVGLYLITGISGNTLTIQSVAGSSNIAAGVLISTTGLRIAPVQFASDSSDRGATANYFYELRGILDDSGLLDYVHYNIVALVHQYPVMRQDILNNGVFAGSRLTWGAPDNTEPSGPVSNWPTTPA